MAGRGDGMDNVEGSRLGRQFDHLFLSLLIFFLKGTRTRGPAHRTQGDAEGGGSHMLWSMARS
jgi:hypothetical protein